jgi:hypothetical protein
MLTMEQRALPNSRLQVVQRSPLPANCTFKSVNEALNPLPHINSADLVPTLHYTIQHSPSMHRCSQLPAELHFLRSRLHLVDLAGSERVRDTGCVCVWCFGT